MALVILKLAAAAYLISHPAGFDETSVEKATPTPSTADRELTDAEIYSLNTVSYDKRTMMFKHVVLGRHNGAKVVADYPCSDLCPDYTVRIIHYAVPVAFCDAVEGAVVVKEPVPFGVGAIVMSFCKPAVLAYKY